MDFEKFLIAPGMQLMSDSQMYKSAMHRIDKLCSAINRKLLEMLQYNSVEFKSENYRYNSRDKFPGSMVVSLSLRRHPLTTLGNIVRNDEDYLVCLKSDGVRYLLAILNTGHLLLIDRILNIFEVKTNIKGEIFAEEARNCVEIAHLFDGELIKGLGGEYLYHFQVFDVIVYEKHITVSHDYMKRLAICVRFIDEFSHASEFIKDNKTSTGSSDDHAPEILIICKDFYHSKDTPFVLDALAQLALYDNQFDGVIFTKINYPYVPGPNRGLLKWKPEFLNSIDFLVVENNAIIEKYAPELKDAGLCLTELYVIKNSRYMLYDYMFLTNSEECQKFRNAIKPLLIGDIRAECAILEIRYADELSNENINQLCQCIFDADMDRIRDLIRESVFGSYFSETTVASYCLFRNLSRRINITTNNLTGNWSILRTRNDKTFPNSLNTADSVSLSIFEERITQKALIEAFNQISNKD